MLGGIVFQLGESAISLRRIRRLNTVLVIIVLYSFMSTEFLFRYVHDRPVGGFPASQSQTTLGGADFRGEMDTKIKIMVAGLGFNILCLFIRYVSRQCIDSVLICSRVLVLSTVPSNYPMGGTDVSSTRRCTSVRQFFTNRASDLL